MRFFLCWLVVAALALAVSGCEDMFERRATKEKTTIGPMQLQSEKKGHY